MEVPVGLHTLGEIEQMQDLVPVEVVDGQVVALHAAGV
jgi:hypothetical protein